MKLLKFTQLSGRIVFYNKNLSDKKLTAFVFFLKNGRFPCFFNRYFSLQIPKAGTP
ncbi:hypothetical protein [Moraxella lacunata]|uniref:hypothetical protein n=1 Tax=Moraxella lacunata TaxID=477 RepID=UPI003EE13BD2